MNALSYAERQDSPARYALASSHKIDHVSIYCPTRGPASVAIWVGVNSKHSFPYLRYIRPVPQYCAFSLIILCPWWEYIYTEEQLIDKSADVHVVYVSKTQDLLNGPISDGCPFI